MSGPYLFAHGWAERDHENIPADPVSGELGPPGLSISNHPDLLLKIEEIFHISQQFRMADTLPALLDLIAAKVAVALDAEGCRVVLLREDGSWQCQAAFAHGELQKTEPAHETALAQLIYRQAVQKERPTIVPRGQNFWPPGLNQREQNFFTLSVCLFPLRLNKRAIGILALGANNNAALAAFNGEKRNLAMYLAEQAAEAILRLSAESGQSSKQKAAFQARSHPGELHGGARPGDYDRIILLGERLAAACHLSEEDLHEVSWACRLHDLGTSGIPKSILDRPGPLTETEWAIVHRHPEIGANIVLQVSHLSGVAELIRCHHEHFDGSGYPRGLAGDQIPVGARVLAVVDSYLSMTEGRSYRPPVSNEEALVELKRCAGSQFDPRVVGVFISLMNGS